MPSELDRKYDAVLAEVTGEGGRIQIGRDARGPGDRHQPAADPADACSTPSARSTAPTEAVVAGDERLTFAELNAHATALARALAGGWSVAKGDRVAHRDAQLPGLDRRLHGGAEGGRRSPP